MTTWVRVVGGHHYMRGLPFVVRFEAKIDKTGDCHVWLGAQIGRPSKLYGGIAHLGKTRKAHRVAWELYRGPIPSGMWVLHTCDNRLCVNPEHLYLGTHADNMRDMTARGRHSNSWKFGHPLPTHCGNGHEYTTANTRLYRHPSGEARRICIACEKNRRLRGGKVERP